ncbi:hypothetical protein PENSPDRAFT_648655 [Peniophora sp. CONT]|nr:hypothetical protein PENSPDRAFT_648655 [Peniophora sp. CONT]
MSSTSEKKDKKAAKRAKTSTDDGLTKKKVPAKRHGKQGRLSVLPTLPMDILYEIFAHLSPADLLSLARTTKSFRGILLSRQSTFLWRNVLDTASAEGGYPPRPEDMDEPAWANLVFGGSWCETCGSKTSKDVLWAVRRRLCKNCREKNMITIYGLKHPTAMAPKTKWSDILPSDNLDGEMWAEPSRRFNSVFKKDVSSYTEELRALRATDGDWINQRSQLDADRKAKTTAIMKHADICYKAEKARVERRVHDLGNLRDTRFEQIKARLLELGYAAVDIEHFAFRRHPEVKAPKPVTAKMWARLLPIVQKAVKGVRDLRLQVERRRRRERREDAIEDDYNNAILRTLPWSMISYAPRLRRVWERPGYEDVKTLLLRDDTEASEEFRSSVRQTLLSSTPKVQQSILDVVDKLRSAMPQSWMTAPSPSPTPLHHHFANSDFILDLSPAADLDRAAIVFRCCTPRGDKAPRIIHFGLDVLADNCVDHDTTLEPDDGLHSLVVQMLTLLDLDPATTTPLDLDKIDPVFICTNGHPSPSGLSLPGAAFSSWRDAVAHGDTCRPTTNHKTDAPVYRLASTLEARYIRALANLRFGRRGHDIWGCCHCDEHLKFVEWGSDMRWFQHEQSWKTPDEIWTHLLASHSIEDRLEGRDYFYYRRFARARFTQGSYEDSSLTLAGQRIDLNPLRLPDVPLHELETLVLAKEAELATTVTLQ